MGLLPSQRLAHYWTLLGVVLIKQYYLNGKWYTPNALSEISGIPAHTIRDRIRRGYSVEEAVKPIATHDSVREFSESSW